MDIVIKTNTAKTKVSLDNALVALGENVKKEIRQKIYKKYNGHCAYCGSEITYNKMQVDHIVPIYRDSPDFELEKYNITRGTDDISNFNPACKSCNSSKSTYSIKEFRKQLMKRLDNQRRDSSQFRMLERYGIIEQVKSNVKFYFEQRSATTLGKRVIK